MHSALLQRVNRQSEAGEAHAGTLQTRELDGFDDRSPVLLAALLPALE
jgi:hypothetical protein